jgi:hypothetical protein
MIKIYLLLLILGISASTILGQTCPPGPPTSPYDGTTDGTLLPTGDRQFNFEYALLAGFDCFEKFHQYFPQNLSSSGAISPNHLVVDMAYTTKGTLTFSNVQASAKNNYTLVVRYAFDFGLFPGVTDRPMGLMVNGVVLTYNMHFHITYSFDVYKDSSIVVPLNAGKNTIEFFDVTNHGVPRLDAMVVTSNANNICSGPPTTPGGLAASPATQGINLNWAASTSPADCKVRYYDVYRSSKSDFVPSASNRVAGGLTPTSYNDHTGLLCSTAYYYLVQAVDTAGASASMPASARTGPCAGEIKYEAESSAVFNASTSSGPIYRIFAWTGFTDGQGTTLDATAAGQSVTINLSVPVAGAYEVKFATKAFTSRGIVQLSVPAGNVGLPEDLYASTPVWKLFDLGTVSFSSANVALPFKFTSVSKNPASSGFTQAFDYISLAKK